ncbi:MAG: glycerol-3-phosphate dehydrogenase, partial [Campylobacterota bacterium]|nr:glycerol-3-phosphate dehydrogenase [Campylobacterota bacterium]
AEGKSKEEILKELGEVAEGIGTAYALYDIAKKKDLYLPKAREVYNMLEGLDPNVSLSNFLAN